MGKELDPGEVRDERQLDQGEQLIENATNPIIAAAIESALRRHPANYDPASKQQKILGSQPKTDEGL